LAGARHYQRKQAEEALQRSEVVPQYLRKSQVGIFRTRLLDYLDANQRLVELFG